MQQAGYCGDVLWSDARAFGPVTWHALHLIAQNYPGGIGDNELPNNATIAACDKFTQGLPWMLPAHGMRFKTLLDAHPHRCVDGYHLQSAMVTAHNNISDLVGGPDPWTVQQAADYYTNATKCLTDIQWGKKELCRVTAPHQVCTTGPNANCTGCIPYTGLFAPKGFCGTVPSANPRVFGPWVWQTLHVMAEFYPDKPSDAAMAACNNFTAALPLMLPCDHCGYHLNETMHLYAPKPICTSSKALQTFLVEAHNRVNNNVHPLRKDWTYDEAKMQYRSTHVCLHGNVTGDVVHLDRGTLMSRPLHVDVSDSCTAATAILIALVVVLLCALYMIRGRRAAAAQNIPAAEIELVGKKLPTPSSSRPTEGRRRGSGRKTSDPPINPVPMFHPRPTPVPLKL